MAHDLAKLDKHIKTCIAIFVSLLVLTVFTVAVSYLDLATSATITLALTIALIKGTLVVTYFMHLVDEKVLIYFSLGLTVVFFFFLMILPIATNLDELIQVIKISH